MPTATYAAERGESGPQFLSSPGARMRQIDTTTWECTACDARVTVPRGRRPLAELLTVPGRPRERVVTVSDEIVHRCTYATAPE